MKKYLFSILAVGVAGLCFAALSPDAPEGTSVNVTQHHNNPSRDGLFIDPAFTTAAAASLTRDLSFNGTIVGNVYAQPLYVEAARAVRSGHCGDRVEQCLCAQRDHWRHHLAAQCRHTRASGLPCGNINPLGITATPVVDLASRSLFFDAEVSGSGQPDLFPERRHGRDQSRLAGDCQHRGIGL